MGLVFIPATYNVVRHVFMANLLFLMQPAPLLSLLTRSSYSQRCCLYTSPTSETLNLSRKQLMKLFLKNYDDYDYNLG